MSLQRDEPVGLLLQEGLGKSTAHNAAGWCASRAACTKRTALTVKNEPGLFSVYAMSQPQGAKHGPGFMIPGVAMVRSTCRAGRLLTENRTMSPGVDAATSPVLPHARLSAASKQA